MISMSRLLAELSRGGLVTGRHVVVTAHPDDETISFGGALSQVTNATIVQLTTGSRALGDEASVQRRQERIAAFAAAGWSWPVIECGSPGREAHRSLERLVPLLRQALAGADVVWTHPYEGGHLDHDTAAWLVQEVCTRPLRMEFASYHCNATTQTFGDFWPDPTVVSRAVTLTGAVLARKRAAIAAYESQAAILRKFPAIDREVYRAAPVYDFTRPPAPPRCRWDVKRYQPTTAEWRATVAAAQVAA